MCIRDRNKVGMSPDRLVNLVCNRLLNQPIEDRPSKITEPRKDGKPFNLNDYDIHKFNPQDRETQKRFYQMCIRDRAYSGCRCPRD